MTGSKKEIRHSFFVDAPPAAVFEALIRGEEIRKWWTTEARVENGRGVFGWSGYGWAVELEMEQDPVANTVVWKCTKSNMQDTHAWEGTIISFGLTGEKQGTRLDFAQTGYSESPCYEACNQGWAFFVGGSLKQYLETGKGIPYPEMQDTSVAEH